MKKGGPNPNRSFLHKDNIIKPSFDTSMEEDRKVLKSYSAEVDEIFFSRYEVTQHGLILKHAVLIVIRKVMVTPEVQSNPSFSLDDVQSMINSALERQAKSSDKLMHRLLEEWMGKNLQILMWILFLLLLLLILLKPILKQVAHWQEEQPNQTHQPSPQHH
jgi:hypothetical protein